MWERFKSLQPSCLGFGFFWSIPMLMMLGTPQISAPSDQWLLFVWTQQLSLVLALPLCIFVYRRFEGGVSSGSSFLAGFLLSTASLCYLLAFSFGYNSTFMSVVAGVLLGVACAVSFLLWQTVYANEGQSRSAIYLPISSIIVVIICLLLKMTGFEFIAFSMVVLIPFSASYMLYRSIEIADPFTIRPLRRFTARVIGDIWKPVLCAMVICFAWALAKHMPALFDTTLITAILIGIAAASLIIVLAELFTEKGVEVLNVYQAIFPFTGIVLFIPGLFGEQWMQLLIGSLSFGSQTLMLLMFLLAAGYASRTQFSPALIYGICVIPLQAAALFGDSIGFAVVAATLAEGHVMRIAVICLVALFFGLILISFSRKRRVLSLPSDDTLLINPDPKEEDVSVGNDTLPDGKSPSGTIMELSAEVPHWHDLSSREIEVVGLLLKGNSVAAIAKKLFISENTTRGHTKRIYRKLEIHSRQELIDLFEGERPTG